MYYLSIVLGTLFLLSGCTLHEKSHISSSVAVEQNSVEDKIETIDELQRIPQEIGFYTKNVLFHDLNTTELSYEKKYFSVWSANSMKTTLKDAMWADRLYRDKEVYGENLQPLAKSFFEKNLKNANYEAFGKLNQRGVTLRHVDLRAMPEEKPLFLDPSKAGEGFPFDYLQNSSIAANKPLRLSHYSKDREWVFVESSFAFGWIKSKDFVVIKQKYSDLWQKAEQVFLLKDNIPLYNEKGEFLFHSQIGMMLALIKEDKESYTILTIGKDRESKAVYFKTKIPKSIAHNGILPFTATNINKILQEISKSKYGWGGLYGERDCSSTLRDFYAPFGLWLPRNSYKQSLSGSVVMMEGLSSLEKLERIKKEATPFRTLIYKHGHIGLYVGTLDGEVIFYQNVWGVKTLQDKVEGRFIIGKPIFSTLEVGSNLKYFDKNSTMLQKLKSITKL